MKTFEDLEFTQISEPFMTGKKARMMFKNGYGVSVVSHTHSYGGKDGLFELAVLFDNEIHYDNPVANGDVVGYLRPEDVTDAMSLIQKF